MEIKRTQTKAPKQAAPTAALIAFTCAALAGPAPAFAAVPDAASSTSLPSESVFDALSVLGPIVDINAVIEEATTTLGNVVSTLLVIIAILGFIGTIVTAVLAEWLFRRHTSGAAKMIRERTGATIGSGVIGAIVAPLLVFLLVCLGITLPVAGGVAFAAFSISAVATGFMGASLFKLAFKNMGRFKCALAGGAIMGALGAIPYLGGIVSTLAFMYLLGYILQNIYLSMQDPSPDPAAITPGQEGPRAAQPEPVPSSSPALLAEHPEEKTQAGNAETEDTATKQEPAEIGKDADAESDTAEPAPQAEDEAGTETASETAAEADKAEPAEPSEPGEAESA